jgi:cholest-4-en-3-one 26-monooxygenase
VADAIDLTQPEFWMGDPYPQLAALRTRAPVFWHVAGDHPFWAITRYDDIVTASKNPQVFCSGQGIALVESELGQVETLVNMDDPEHKWLRALVSRGFTPGRMRLLETHVRDLGTSILGNLDGRSEIDFVEDLAALLPIYVIGEMLGVPRNDQHLIKVWSDALTEAIGEESGLQAYLQMVEYLTEMQRARHDSPSDDLVSLLMEAEVEGRRLSEDQQRGFFLLLEFAGNETTRNTLAGGMLALLEHPDQWLRLCEDPALIPSAVEEMLRFVSPVNHFRRTVTANTELGGQPIKAGDWVVLFYGAGNRDPDIFEEPDRFDITRQPNPHIAFGGGGAHFCLGAALARLELRIMFEELVRRYPRIQLSGPATRVRSNFIRGIKTMPVELGPRSV